MHFGSCHYVIKHLMRGMMNYHCLRVLRRRVKRTGKHSPGFSMFRTRVHGCSDAELCRLLGFDPRSLPDRFFSVWIKQLWPVLNAFPLLRFHSRSNCLKLLFVLFCSCFVSHAHPDQIVCIIVRLKEETIATAEKAIKITSYIANGAK